MSKRSLPALTLGCLLCLLYSIIFSGQILGFLGLYRPLLAIPLTVLVLAVSGFFYLKTLPEQAQSQAEPGGFRALDLWLGLCAVGLILTLIAVPLILWPASPAGKTLTWDAGLFQFPKAIELFRSGSFWNMNVCYAEYPLGYESLLAFSMLFGSGPALYGSVHFVLALFLIAAMWQLAHKHTGLPAGLLLLAILGVLLYGYLNKDNNPWWIYEPLLFTVGKNDLFQGAAVLAALAFAPLTAARHEKLTWNPVGFAMASMVAFSIKPNSLIILPLWLLAFYALWKAVPARVSFLKQAALMGAVALPGLLWIFRNLTAQGALFTGTSLKLTAWSIANNLNNPALYKFIPVYLTFFVALSGAALLLAALRLRITIHAALTLLALLVGFAITPASAFHGNHQERAEIAWRFSVAFISYALLLILVFVTPLLKKGLDLLERYRLALFALAFVGLALSGFFIWRMKPLLRYVPENAIILRDQFEQPVGTNGYYSAYDYARKNIRNSSIIVDNGLPFYAYDTAYTNTTACAGSADYFIVFNTNWPKPDPGEYPEYIQSDGWAKAWDVLYEDPQSRVFKRK